MVAQKCPSIPAALLAALLSPSCAVRAAEPSEAAAPSEFCASLARVLAAAPAGFETLQGKARRPGVKWPFQRFRTERRFPWLSFRTPSSQCASRR